MGGGANGLGSVFRVTTNGTFSTIVSFGGTNGMFPSSALVADGNGAFYGTTLQGGANSFGTLFHVNTSGELTTVFSFETNGPDPNGLFVGVDGAIYGLSEQQLNPGFTDRRFAFSVFRLSANHVVPVAEFTMTNTLNGPLI